jgi:hypothetical protein
MYLYLDKFGSLVDWGGGDNRTTVYSQQEEIASVIKIKGGGTE